ncbi:ubiquitin-like modifier-activating enzyme ATG7 [Armigeres subalbatus]|uniref:ubiquitin-like modifier-activating enzyme ATG7 n=1 Tax=Armigeres subalbatus TaxID=124917 RepID=UPI002ED48DCF
MTTSDRKLLRFMPPKSFVHHDFWYKLADIKLNIDKLKDSAKHIYAFISDTDQSKLLVEVDCSSFNSQQTISAANINCYGILLNKNTIEEFKGTDKNDLIRRTSVEYLQQLLSKDKVEHSSEIFFFILFSYADFKTHKYYYWFAFPALRDVIYNCEKQQQLLSIHFEDDMLNVFQKQMENFSRKFAEPVFVYNESNCEILKLSDLVSHISKEANFKDVPLDSTYICCKDHSTGENPSWLLRQLLGYLVYTCPQLANKEVKLICLRETLQSSVVLYITIPATQFIAGSDLWTGWEANENGKLLPKLADMSKVMDPQILAERSISLNLTLMKWRLLPNLDLDIISRTKYLLLGAGTLGCGVARSLLAWGARHISFVDYGNVSLSNPVRQSLYMYEDALHGGRPKASTAANRLKEINPCVTSTGYCLKIHMPGHSIGESQLEETNEALEKLESLIQDHDVIFLLTDSRESRWLPTMLAAYYKKMTINAALGFDSFLVMRHGSQSNSYVPQNVKVDGFKEVLGSQLGCYFCNDVVAPGNSLKDRTLDQQCTVTRPAVACMASALAVELAVALLQNNARDGASAYYKTSNNAGNVEDIPEDILGIVPHSIRGNISVFSYLITATERFSQCIACSKQILEKFDREKRSFVMDALNSAKILEDVAGISSLTCSVEEMIDFSGSDTE